MKRTISTPMLALPAVAVWLAACGLLSWTQLAYDGAVSTNHIYFWVYGGALLLSGLCSQDDGRPAASRTSRWGGALLMLLAAALAYLVVERVGQAGIGYVLYNLQFWWIAAMGLLLLAVTLWQNSRFRRPRKPAHSYSPLARSAAVVLISFLPLLLVTLLYLAVLHPVTVDEIKPVGEAEGGKFIGCISGERTETPLGVYFFADGDRWYYYDVLTGAPAAYDDPYRPA